MKRFPSTECLEATLAAAKLGSLSRAAEELGVTHGAVSRRVHELERWLGAPIFERHGRGVHLTPIGAKLAKRVEISMSAISALSSEVQVAQRPDAVRLSVLPSFARLWLLPNLLALQGDPPDVDLQITAEHRLANLGRREADLAVRVGSGDWAGGMAHRIFGETVYPVAHPSLASRIGSEAWAKTDPPLLHDGNSNDWRQWFAAAGLTYRHSANARRFDDYDLVLAAARTGAGAALARMPLAMRYLAGGDLIRLAGPALCLERAHWLIVGRAETRTAVLRVKERILELGKLQAL